MKFSNQLSAVLTLSRYSLLATLRSPTSVVFSLLFPIVFIVVFGSMVGDQTPKPKLAIGMACDTANLVFRAFEQISSVVLERGMTPAEQSDALKKGRLTAVMNISLESGSTMPHYNINLESAGASPATLSLLNTILREAIQRINEKVFPKIKP